MAKKKAGKASKKIKTLAARKLSARHAKSVKGGVRKAGEKPVEY